MAELDPNFQYRQAATGTLLQGVQLGASIAERRQMMETRRRELEQNIAQNIIQQNLQQAQADMYRQRTAQVLQESEADKNDMPLFAEFQNQASLFADDDTGTIQAPVVPEFKNPRNRIAAISVLRDARLRNVGQRAKAKMMDDAIEAGAVDFGPQGITINQEKLNSFRELKGSQDLSRTPMDIEQTEVFIESNPQFSESTKAMLRGRARTRGGVGVERANVTVQDLKNVGLVQTPQEEQEAKAQAVQNKLTPTTKVTDAISASDQAVNQMRSAFKRIQEFNAKYNSTANSNNAFQEFVGPIDNPVLSAEARFAGVTDLDKKEALSIIQQIQQVILDYRNAKFGATLTEGETRALEEVVGTPRRNDFLLLTESFSNNLERGIKNQLGRYKYAPNLIEFYREYQPERFGGGQTNAPSGLNIDVNAIDAELRRRGINP